MVNLAKQGHCKRTRSVGIIEGADKRPLRGRRSASGGESLTRPRSKPSAPLGRTAELETERLYGHFIGDSGGYRPEAERKGMKDPIPAYRRRLLDETLVSAADMTALEAKVQAEVDAAMRFGRESEYPDATDALERLYA